MPPSKIAEGELHLGECSRIKLNQEGTDTGDGHEQEAIGRMKSELITKCQRS